VIVLNPTLEARKAAKREWRKERERNPEVKARKLANHRSYLLLTRYSLTEEQRQQMLEGQGRKCRICGKPNPKCIDHCHSTGTVRGVLCHQCNLGLGHFFDNPSLLNKAIDYLCSPPPAAHSRRRSPPAAIGAPNGDGGVAGLRTKRRTR